VTKMEIIMCPPKYMSSGIRNNKWMEDYEGDIEVNTDIAMKQFFDLYSSISQHAFVWLLPPMKGLQDQVYVANVACVLPHLDKTAVLANFKADGRPGEEEVVDDLLEDLGYDYMQCPYNFEGEAELKWIRDNIYVGGYGQRSSNEGYDWMEKKYDMKIIRLKETDPYLYHVDCSIFPLDQENVLLSTQTIAKETVQKIERVANVIPVSKQFAYESMCNVLRVGSILFCCGQINNDPDVTSAMNNEIIDICRRFGIQPVFIDLSEYSKSGAALSCMCMHLTYDKVKFRYP